MAKHITLLNKDPQTLNTNSPKGNILSALSGSVKTVKVADIKTAEPFVNLFAIREEVLSSIIENMREKGYDNACPVIIWKEKDILIDGHTRLHAAKAAGIASIPAVYASFESEEAVLDYMHRLQFNRRNITDADLIKLIINALPQYEKKYGEGSKAEFLTKRFTGLSEAKAKKALVVIENINEDIIKKIEQGEMTIREAYTKISNNKNKLSKKVPWNFFKNDGEKRIIRTDDNGVFYFRNYETKKEMKSFALPKYLNSPVIRKRIAEVIEEEMEKEGLS